jgi:hypothetical protein
VEGVVKRERPGEEPEGAAQHATRRVASILIHPTPRVCPGVNAGQVGTRGLPTNNCVSMH